jgi:hypothetical protein
MRTTTHCENCGAILHGPFCSQCGQHAGNPIVSLREFIGNALSDLYSTDSRLWRTILPLYFRPGLLTSEYLAGRRGRYLPPFRTYLVLSLIFFMIVSLSGSGWNITINNEQPPNDARTSGIEIYLVDEGDDFSCQEIQIPGNGYLDDYNLGARVREACEKIKADSGGSLVRALVDNIPLMMFCFIPLVAVLMKILYLFSHRKYIEHLLFLIHCHAFFFLTLAVVAMATALANAFPALSKAMTIVSVCGWIYIPVYLFIAMRHVYRQSRFLTGLKYMLLLASYAVNLFVAFASTFVYTVWTL